MAMPLEGVRVLDLTTGISGAICTMQMGELGAEVIKIEGLQGNDMRDLGPKIKGESAVFIELNRNKKSTCVDYQGRKGRDILRQLAKISEVFVEDLKPGEAASLGFTYEELAEINRGLVYCSIYPFGDEGPYVNMPATELELQAMSGVMAWLGKLGEEPVRLGADVIGTNGGIQACSSILAALYWKRRSGYGQRIVISLYGVALVLMTHLFGCQTNPDRFAGYFMTGPYDNPETGYKTKDKNIMFGMLTRTTDQAKESFLKFCKEIGLEKLLEDPYFVEFGMRTLGVGRDAQEMKPLFETAFENFTAAELIDIVDRCGGMGASILNYDDLYNPLHPQVVANEMISELEHPRVGSFKMVNMPWKLSKGERKLGTPAPALGEHTEEILRLIGYPDSQIDLLQSSGIVKGNS